MLESDPLYGLPENQSLLTVEKYTEWIADHITRNKASGTLAGVDVPERDVDLMLEKHGKRIKAIREIAAKHFTPEEKAQYLDVDEWVLRYCLSFSNDDKAAAAIGRAVQWMREDESKRMHQEVVSGAFSRSDAFAPIRKYICGGYIGAMRDGGFPLIQRLDKGSQSKMMDAISRDELLYSFVGQRLLISMVQLEIMKRCRRIVKFALVIDMTGGSFTELSDRRFGEVQAEVSKISGDVFPQFLQKMCLVNPPSFFYYLFALAKHLFPKKTLEKMEVCSTQKDFMNSDLFKNWLDLDHVPVSLGGNLKELDYPKVLVGDYIERDLMLKEVKVAARSKTVLVEQFPTSGKKKLRWDFGVKGYGVEVSASVQQGTFNMDKVDSNNRAIFTPSKESAKETLLEPIKLKDNDEAKIEGTWEITTPCEITLQFDNTWSKFRSKVANYLITVEDDGDGQEETLSQEVASMKLNSIIGQA